jgi:hypothetical protein
MIFAEFFLLCFVFVFSLFVFFFFFLWHTRSPFYYSPGWLQTWDLSALGSQTLGLHVCAATPKFFNLLARYIDAKIGLWPTNTSDRQIKIDGFLLLTVSEHNSIVLSHTLLPRWVSLLILGSISFKGDEGFWKVGWCCRQTWRGSEAVFGAMLSFGDQQELEIISVLYF